MIGAGLGPFLDTMRSDEDMVIHCFFNEKSVHNGDSTRLEAERTHDFVRLTTSGGGNVARSILLSAEASERLARAILAEFGNANACVEIEHRGEIR